MADALAIWLYATKVALVERRPKGRMRLSYTQDAIEKYSLGTPVLSLTLPVTPDPYPNNVVRAFLDGLLPEGDPRKTVAADFRLVADDTYGLIGALGRDCAGALIIQPDDDPPPPQPTTETATPLTERELNDLVANLRNAPLGVGARVRMSLAGVHEKLLLTRRVDGTWGRPVEGTPSTHILKPELAQYPQIVENEAFCMRFAKHLGLPVASVETTTIDGRRLLIVERYDRIVHADGRVERIHQEDFCQATAILPDRKYEQDGGPPLRRIAGILQTVAESGAAEALLRGVIVNVLIGNGDAHGKNFSLLHDSLGALRLSPLYDVVSTLLYGDDRLAMYIDDVRRTNRVTADRIVKEAARWGLPKDRAAEILEDILERAPAAADAARQETVGLPDGLLKVFESQVAQLRSKAELT